MRKNVTCGQARAAMLASSSRGASPKNRSSLDMVSSVQGAEPRVQPSWGASFVMLYPEAACCRTAKHRKTQLRQFGRATTPLSCKLHCSSLDSCVYFSHSRKWNTCVLCSSCRDLQGGRTTSRFFTTWHRCQPASAMLNATRDHHPKLCSQTTQESTARVSLFYERREKTSEQQTLEDCEYQQARLAAWYENLHKASGSVHDSCATVQNPCPEHSISGCCETGMPHPANSPREFHDAFTWVRSTVATSGSYTAISLVTSDNTCSVTRSLEGLIRYARRSLVLLHVGCHSPNTLQNRSFWASLSPSQIIVNPQCVPTARVHGSILHAHMLNVAMLGRLVEATLVHPPSRIVLGAADMFWVRSGVEDFVQQSVSSVYQAHRAPIVPPVAGMRHNSSQFYLESRLRMEVAADEDLRAIVSSTPERPHKAARNQPQGALDETHVLLAKHEGSFYPWDTAWKFYRLLRSRGPLGRLNLRTCRCALQRCVEEVYLPTFAGRSLGNAPLVDVEAPTAGASRRADPLLQQAAKRPSKRETGKMRRAPRSVAALRAGSADGSTQGLPSSTDLYAGTVTTLRKTALEQSRVYTASQQSFAHKFEGRRFHDACKLNLSRAN